MSGAKGPEAGDLPVSINVARLPQDGLSIRFEANEAQRAGMAERFGIVAVERLEVDLRAARWQRDGIAVRGRLDASVLQTDVVTLEPVRQIVDEGVELFFVPEGSRLARAASASDDDEIELDPGDETVETFHGDQIDLGEPLTQLLGLALDPYPRGDGVEFEERREGEKEPSPFAVLAKLREGKRQ